MSGEVLQRAHAALESFIQQYFTDEKKHYPYGEWFDPLYFDLAEYVGRKGKRIRPLMFLMSYRAFGGTRRLDDPALLQCATALELLHTFVLMHDDVIDRSATRRGLPTYHKLASQRIHAFGDDGRTGENVATVMGDIVFTMAIRAMAGLDIEADRRQRALDIFLRTTADTGAGEIQDILFGVRDIAEVTGSDIAHMYHLKTTRYTFEAPCVVGAVLAGAAEEKIRALPRITEPLGLAFQIQNDLLECRYRDAADLAASADLLEGKKTMVIFEAYNRLDEMDRSFLQLCLGSSRRSESTLAKLRDLILKSGAIASMSARADELFQEAETAIASEAFSPDESRQLAETVGLIRQQVRAAA
jgi:geranylgeranyl diphosphate synthase type I